MNVISDSHRISARASASTENAMSRHWPVVVLIFVALAVLFAFVFGYEYRQRHRLRTRLMAQAGDVAEHLWFMNADEATREMHKIALLEGLTAAEVTHIDGSQFARAFTAQEQLPRREDLIGRLGLVFEEVMTVPLTWRDHPIGRFTVTYPNRNLLVHLQAAVVIILGLVLVLQYLTSRRQVRLLRQREGRIRELAEHRRQALHESEIERAKADQATQRAVNLAREAEEATRSKDQFLANISHEIRTPLNGVVGMADLLLDSGLDDGQRRFAEIIAASGESLVAIIDDILDVAKIGAGRMELTLHPFEPRGLLEEVAAILSKQAFDKGLELILAIDRDTPRMVMGDALRLRQVMVNLVGNAVKYTDHGHVLVRLTVQRDDTTARLTFAVEDTGVGIPDNLRTLIFEKFTQADPSSTRRHGGAGLGLAISRELVQLMDGTLDLRTANGAGSAFTFTLAVPLADPAVAAPVPMTPQSRVLVVAPQPLVRTVLVDDLWSSEIDCRACAEPVEGRRYLDQGWCPDLVIIDRQRSDAAGDDLAEYCRSACGPRILILGLDRAGASTRRRSAYDRILGKPVCHDDLVTAVTAHRHRMESGMDIPERLASVPAEPRSDDDTDTRPRVLVVEDNEINQMVLAEMLEDQGCRVSLAGDGAEALAQLERVTFTLVFMDCHLPVLDGLEATRRFRARGGGGAHTTVVAVTGDAMTDNRERCRLAGMDDFLAKPYRKRDIERLVERYAARPAADGVV